MLFFIQKTTLFWCERGCLDVLIWIMNRKITNSVLAVLLCGCFCLKLSYASNISILVASCCVFLTFLSVPGANPEYSVIYPYGTVRYHLDREQLIEMCYSRQLWNPKRNQANCTDSNDLQNIYSQNPLRHLWILLRSERVNQNKHRYEKEECNANMCTKLLCDAVLTLSAGSLEIFGRCLLTVTFLSFAVPRPQS